MKEEEKLICNFIHEFVSLNWDKIDKERCNMSNTSKEVFLDSIRDDVAVALWVLFEVADWGMDKEYLMENILEYDPKIVTIDGKYIRVENNWGYKNNPSVKFVERKEKLVYYYE